MKPTWRTAHGGGAGCVQFASTKKRSTEGEELKNHIDNAVGKVPKQSKRIKATVTHEPISYDDPENYTF